MNCKPFLLILIVSAFFASDVFAEWKEHGEHNGVQGYSRQALHSPYGEIKTVTMVPASLATIAEVLRDVPVFPEWMSTIKESKIIEVFDANNLLIYNVIKFPWPFSDRDVIYENTTSVSPLTGIISVASRMSDKAYKLRTTDYVETTYFFQEFKLEYIENQNTRVTFILQIDLNTSLPNSVMEQSVLGSSYLILEGMKDMVKKQKYKNSDPLSEQNREITKAVIRARLKKYTSDTELIEYIVGNHQIIEFILKGEASKEGFEKLMASPMLRNFTIEHSSLNDSADTQ